MNLPQADRGDAWFWLQIGPLSERHHTGAARGHGRL